MTRRSSASRTSRSAALRCQAGCDACTRSRQPRHRKGHRLCVDGQERPAERVRARRLRGVGEPRARRLLGSPLHGRPCAPSMPLGVPGRPARRAVRSGRGKIAARCSRLLPSGSSRGSSSTVSLTSQAVLSARGRTAVLVVAHAWSGLTGGHDALCRIVEQHRTDPDGPRELELLCRGEEGLVLPDRLALVVEHGPAAADPPVPDIRAAVYDRAGGSLALALDHPAEAVRVAERTLDLRVLVRCQVADMGLAGPGPPPRPRRPPRPPLRR